jgi:hypothetical protein
MTTKTLFLCFFTLLVMATSVSAHDAPKANNEIRLGYGVLTGPEIANSLMSVWPAIGISIFKDTITDYRCSFYGAAGLEYMRIIKPWLHVGATFSVNPISTYLKGRSGFEFTYNYYLFTLMPRVDFCYINKGIFSMYSGVQAGASYIFWQDRNGNSTSTDAGFSFAYHVNALGIRVGKEIGAYMEWGFGFRGIVNFGVSGRF